MATSFQTTDTITGIDINTDDELIIMPGITVANNFDAIDLILDTLNFETQINNYGTIIAGLRAIDSIGSLRVENHGIISSLGFSAIDLSGTDSTIEVRNFGTITADNDLLDTFSLDGISTISLVNHGTMDSEAGDIIADDSSLETVTVVNSGVLHGRTLSMGRTGDGMLLNTGEIVANGITKSFAATGGGVTIVNHGLISGRQGASSFVIVATNSSALGEEDVIVNHGQIVGGVVLYEGNDRLTNYGTGQVLGTVDGGLGNDTLRGGSFADDFVGGQDNDLLVGKDGNDSLNGSFGDDTVQGDAGADTLRGGSNDDLLLGGADDDSLEGGSGDDTLIGGDGDDTILDSSGADLILAGSGNDSVNAGSGDDTMNGNDGDDTLLGGIGNDAMTGGAGADEMLGGDDNDTMNGQDGEDILEGEAGNDILRGGNGDDALAGGEGFDLLTGGQGADTFVFRALTETAAGALRDQILDFEKGVDLIVVAGLSPGVFEFRGTAAFAPSGNPELRLFETAAGSTIVQIDADGNGIAEAEIRVANVTGLTAEDFVL